MHLLHHDDDLFSSWIRILICTRTHFIYTFWIWENIELNENRFTAFVIKIKFAHVIHIFPILHEMMEMQKKMKNFSTDTKFKIIMTYKTKYVYHLINNSMELQLITSFLHQGELIHIMIKLEIQVIRMMMKHAWCH